MLYSYHFLAFGVGRLRKISPLALYDKLSNDFRRLLNVQASRTVKHQRIPLGVGTHSYNAFLCHGVASSRACND